MDMHIEKACKFLEMSEEEVLSWITSMEPCYFTYICDEGVGAFYTDGDDGLIWFDPDCEIFEEEGIKVSVMGNYCDIDFESMHKIHSLLSGNDDL
jgi:hypothetical protein